MMNLEKITHEGIVIGDVFMEEDGEWGAQCYFSDNGWVGSSTREAAIKDLIEDHEEALRHAKEELKHLEERIKEFS